MHGSSRFIVTAPSSTAPQSILGCAPGKPAKNAGTREAKCSGDHPACARCVGRGLKCEYAKEGRVRGPNKPKSRANSTASSLSPLSRTPAPLPPYGDDSFVDIKMKRRRRATTMGSIGGSGIKLEPLSSCMPLGLPSSSSHHGGLDLPLAASKRFSLPAFLSNPPSILPSSSLHALPLHTLSSAYDYHGAGRRVFLLLSVHRFAPRELGPVVCTAPLS
ncbi:hypothetical protein B0H16DRAFT_84121 [Mycena metata]|uniref:Zn(2)-C6 fungal-type domain-containing protein n=1 Tax=Mycena metata TaxID=1033252 RepID=A0AAD7NTC9_9AGAR|nr:hypothetical protein B0H16DRAFT_84121 [Mycena metata]